MNQARLRPHKTAYSSLYCTLAVFTMALAGCRDTSGPDSRATNAALLAGDVQVGLANASLAEPLQVVVTDAVTHAPRENVTVKWAVTSGDATVAPSSSTTDIRGIASASLRLGGNLGAVTVRASADGQVGDPVIFHATAVLPPSITSVTPTSARAGDTVTIAGSDFGTNTSVVSVTFDGVRAGIVSVQFDRIRAVVPSCVPSHAATVLVALGSVQSNPATVTTIAIDGGMLQMARGEVRVFADAAALSCMRLPPDSNASWLLIPQNAAQTYSIPMKFQLSAFAIASPLALRSSSVQSAQGSASHTTFASDWEIALREQERVLAAGWRPPVSALRGANIAVPQVGERRAFNTLNSKNETVKITAEVRAVTEHAIIYQDVEAANAFSTADYERFGHLFDDPIYDTDTQAFGQVSDIDGNGHVIMLLTPQVNRLTPKGGGSYIAGYFYACDLLTKDRCSATNNGEIFYSMVPDPNGTFGDVHSVTAVLRTVPPVVAHEFMHMINFSRRGTLDALWLAEALAHTAEDLVGQVFIDRGDRVTGADFIEANHGNARLYLANPSGTSLIADESPGTIELRGAGWLFLRYLRGLYGENALLAKLTASTLSGAQNVVAQTGRSWTSLLSDFAVAIYADDAPELAGASIDPRFTFVNTNMREMLGTGAPFPLAVHGHVFSDFTVTGSLPSASWQYEYVQSPPIPPASSLNFVFAGNGGGPFTAASAPQLIVMRVK